MEIVKCINCGLEVSAKFCSHCGQPNPPKKITLANMWVDFQSRIYGFDGMFPRTLRDLTIRPGKASLAFINGNRVKYYGPVGYFFLMITLLYLISSILDVPLIELLKSANKATNFNTTPKAGSGQEKFAEIILKYITDNLKLVSFLFIPVQAFCSRFVFFRKSKKNYLQHFVLPFYVQGHIYWLSILSVTLYSVFGFFLSGGISILLSTGYLGYAYADFFSYQSKVKVFLKGIGVYLFSQVLLMVLFSIVLLILLKTNPAIYEMLKPSNNK